MVDLGALSGGSSSAGDIEGGRAVGWSSLSDVSYHATLWLFGGGGGGDAVQGTVDIKPGGVPNSINPRSRGVIPAAILTTADFDAATVAPSSVRFGPGGATIAHTTGHLEDVDRDGDLDLVLHFRTVDTGIACGDETASLTGETFDGQPIAGSDSVRTVGCK